MFYKISFLLSFLFLFLFSNPVHSLSHNFFARSNGLANGFIGIANDEALLFYNPAGLGVERKNLKQKSNEYNNIFAPGNILFLDFYKGPVVDAITYFTYVNAFLFSSTFFTTLTQLYFLSLSNDPLSLSINFSSINKPNNTLAWGISYFSSVNFDKVEITAVDFDDFLNELIKINEAERSGAPLDVNDLLTEEIIDLDMSINSQLAIGLVPYSLSLLNPYDFHIGFNIRTFYLYQLALKIDNILDFIVFNDEFHSFENFSKLPLLDDQLLEGIGLSLDLGVLWEILLPDKENQINLGFSIFDSPGIIFPIISKNSTRPPYTFFLPNIGLGLAWKMPYKINNFFNNTALAIDYVRILDPDIDYLSKLHLGIITDVYNYESKVVFSTTVGFRYLRPSFAASLYIYYFRFFYSLNPVQFSPTFGKEVKYLQKFSFSLYL